MGESVLKPGQSEKESVQDKETPDKQRIGSGAPGPGRPKGSKNKVTVDARELARGLVEDEDYQKKLVDRLKAGELAPALEAMLWHYSYGKPVERIEIGDKAGFFDKVVRQAKGDK